MTKFGDSLRMGYSTLKDAEKKAYDSMLKALIACKPDASIPISLSIDDTLRVQKVLIGDYPELIHVDLDQVQVMNSILSQKVVFQYLVNRTEARRRQTLLRNCVDSILSEGNLLNEKNPYKQLMYFYYYIHKNVVYDYDEYHSGFNLNTDAHNAYGALVEKKAVCEGIALAFLLLAKQCGIPGMFITGMLEGEPHGWTLVKVNDNIYHVDPTKVDHQFDKELHGIDYAYFALSDRDISYNHSWERKRYPACPKGDYLCYKLNDSYIDNIGQFKFLIKQRIRDGKDYAYVKLSDVCALIEMDVLLKSVQNILLENQDYASVNYSSVEHLRTYIFQW